MEGGTNGLFNEALNTFYVASRHDTERKLLLYQCDKLSYHEWMLYCGVMSHCLLLLLVPSSAPELVQQKLWYVGWYI